jgi:hypothetical protein
MKNHKLYEHKLQIGRMKQANTSIGGHGSYRKGHRCPWHLDLGRRPTTSWRAVEELTDKSSCNSVKRSPAPLLASSPRSPPLASSPRSLLPRPLRSTPRSPLNRPCLLPFLLLRARTRLVSRTSHSGWRNPVDLPERCSIRGDSVRLPRQRCGGKTHSVRYIPRTGWFSVQHCRQS